MIGEPRPSHRGLRQPIGPLTLTAVADIWACYKQWGDKGAFFLAGPLDNHGWEWRCYMRDPDGYLIEVGQLLKSPSTGSTTAVNLGDEYLG